MLAESRHGIRGGKSRHPSALKFLIVSYLDRAQIVTRFGRYGHLYVCVDLSGDVYGVGTRLAGLLRSSLQNPA